MGTRRWEGGGEGGGEYPPCGPGAVSGSEDPERTPGLGWVHGAERWVRVGQAGGQGRGLVGLRPSHRVSRACVRGQESAGHLRSPTLKGGQEGSRVFNTKGRWGLREGRPVSKAVRVRTEQRCLPGAGEPFPAEGPRSGAGRWVGCRDAREVLQGGREGSRCREDTPALRCGCVFQREDT